MNQTTCLNCENEVNDNFCPKCGQKTDTHRITFKNFIFHDVLHGTFHIEKGILFTAKQALVRPGKASLDYIAGKRKPYYNVFLLILLSLSLLLFLKHFYNEILVSQGRGPIVDTEVLNDASKQFADFFNKQKKLITFIFVPLAAINTYILFNKKKLNLSEHSIIAGMLLLGNLLISIFYNILLYINLPIQFDSSAVEAFSLITSIITIIYIIYGYYNAFGSMYSVFGFTYRILLFFLLFLFQLIFLLIIAVGFVTNWIFGEVTFTPF